MAYGAKKTEHAGPKKGHGAFYGRKAARQTGTATVLVVMLKKGVRGVGITEIGSRIWPTMNDRLS